MERPLAEAAFLPLRDVFELTQDGFYLVSAEGRMLDANQAYLDLVGRRREDFLRLSIQDIDASESPELIQQRMSHLRREGHARFRTRHRRQDGSVIDVDLAVSYRPERGGSFLVLCRDVTEQLALERALRARDELLTRLGALVPGVIYQYQLFPDGRSCFPFSSAGIRQIYEVEPEQVRTDASLVFERLHPEDRDRVSQAIFASAQDQTAFHEEYRVILPEKGLRWCLCQAQPRLEGDGSTLWHGIITDVTELKEGADRQRRLEAELQQARKLESLGSLAGGVAHDMNNVLAAIMGYAETAVLRLAPEDPSRRAFDVIEAAAQRGAEMVRRLLSFARRKPASSSPVDLNALIREERRLLEHTTLALVTVEEDLEPDLPCVEGEADALAQVVMNLCVNSVDAMPEGGTLRLKTRSHPDHGVVLTIEDTGTGMSPELLEKALEPYFTTKPQGKGTGLGLSLVYSTVQAHGGTFKLTSEVGVGTRAEVCLPRIVPVPGVCEEPAPPRASDLPKRRIVLVEDDPLVRETLKEQLAVLGQTVFTLDRSEGLLALVTGPEGPFDLVFMDLNLPGLGGPAALKALRARSAELPVVVMTGRVDARAEALTELPRVRLLPKPFGLADLRRELLNPP